jgi:DNA-directed RNA polymerase subunit RPC12/RpoP
MDSNMFTCVRCDADLEIADPRNNDQVTCGHCGQHFRLAFDEDEQVWELLPAPTIAGDEGGSSSEEEPFAIGSDPAGLGFLEDEERTP